MVAQQPKTKLTYEDYKNTPEDERYELIDGELIMAAAPKEVHQRVDMKLGWRFGSHVETNDLGAVYSAPFDVYLSETNVVQPDLLFISKERLDIITEANIQGAPDLVVEVSEILSPSTASADWTVKRELYAEYGVKEFWIVVPDARLVWLMLLRGDDYEVVGIYGDGQTVTSTVIEGFSVHLSDIF